MKITISGASGLIGRRVLKMLAGDGHTLQVLSRHAGTNMPGGVRVAVWDPSKGEPPTEVLADADAIKAIVELLNNGEEAPRPVAATRLAPSWPSSAPCPFACDALA